MILLNLMIVRFELFDIIFILIILIDSKSAFMTCPSTRSVLVMLRWATLRGWENLCILWDVATSLRIVTEHFRCR